MAGIITPVEPNKDRHIVVADDDGDLWSMDILSFVGFVTRREYARQGVMSPTPEQVSGSSISVIQVLVRQGWFTAEEYKEAWIAAEVDDLDEELGQL